MQSKIDPSLYFNEGEYVFSLVKHGEHAILLREEFYQQQHKIQKIHFVIGEGNYDLCYGLDLYQLIGNGTYAGRVGDETVVFDKKTDMQNFSREEIFTRLQLDKYKGKSWTVTRNDIRKFTEIIHQEKKRPSLTSRFNIKGRFYGNEGKLPTEQVHNCCTWVVNRLSLAGIDASPYLKKGVVFYTLNLPVLPSQSISYFNHCLNNEESEDYSWESETNPNSNNPEEKKENLTRHLTDTFSKMMRLSIEEDNEQSEEKGGHIVRVVKRKGEYELLHKYFFSEAKRGIDKSETNHSLENKEQKTLEK